MKTNTNKPAATNPHMTQALVSSLECSIYVASLSDYNNGILHGVWLDCLEDSDELEERISIMLADSPTARRSGLPAEEWAIHAHGGFHGVQISESEDLETVCELAQALEEHGETFARFYDYAASGTTVSTCLEQFQDAYHGTFDNLRAFAEWYAEEISLLEGIPSHLQYYFDLESWAQDLELNGDITTIETADGIAVFGHY